MDIIWDFEKQLKVSPSAPKATKPWRLRVGEGNHMDPFPFGKVGKRAQGLLRARHM